MADGTFAAIGLVLGLWDMHANYCDTGCFAKNEVIPRTHISAGRVIHNGGYAGQEVYVRRDLGFNLGPFGFTYGLSVTDRGSVWAGAGNTYTVQSADNRSYIQFHAMTGYYEPGDGIDLGGPIEFRSGIEIGYEARNGLRFGLSYDHRSNAFIYADNTGLESVQFRVSVPTR